MNALLDAQKVRSLKWLAGVSLALAAIYALCSHPAMAATSTVGGMTADFTLFDTIDTDAKAESQNWFTQISSMVQPTFMLLATIEICWAAAIWAFEKDNLNSLAVEIIKKIMFIGFFYALLQYAPQWIPTIADTFQQVGEKATKSPPITTDGIIAQGMALIRFVWSEAPKDLFGILGALGKIIVACFVTIGIVIAYVMVAAQYFTLKIESYVLFAAGAVFLGLGSSSWTKDYVSKYLNYAINVGMRILVLLLILSLTLSAVTKMSGSFKFDYPELLELLAISILQAILAIKAPEMAGALLNGGVGLSAGSAAGAAASGFGSMKLAASVASAGAGLAAKAMHSAVRTGTSAAQGMNNMGKAVSAGQAKARLEGKSGPGAALSGLGKAAAQVGQEGASGAKGLPGKLMNAIKGADRGQQPGVLDRAKQGLQHSVTSHAAEVGSRGEGSSASTHTAPAPVSASQGRPPPLKKGSTTSLPPPQLP